jgi:hypothetical protein
MADIREKATAAFAALRRAEQAMLMADEGRAPWSEALRVTQLAEVVFENFGAAVRLKLKEDRK